MAGLPLTVTAMTDNASTSISSEAVAQPPAAAAVGSSAADVSQTPARAPLQQPRKARAAAGTKRGARPVPPALEQLAALYPQLFGAVFRPMKRGIFQELMEAHSELFDKATLKEALAIHARSTRYLQAVASGQQRHDLQGQPVEAMAPEHIHHALVEVYKRRKGRGQDDLLPRLLARMVDNIDASGLARDDYAALVRNRDEAANAVLDLALAELAERSAREEALLRTLEASGQSVEDFAETYGMDRNQVARSADRARARLAAGQAADAGTGADASETDAEAEVPPGASD